MVISEPHQWGTQYTIQSRSPTNVSAIKTISLSLSFYSTITVTPTYIILVPHDIEKRVEWKIVVGSSEAG